jgi:hypothetical protein
VPEVSPYREVSRFTDPAERAVMLAELPDDIAGVCEVARRQIVHQNLRAYYRIPVSRWAQLTRVWPPVMRHVLQSLAQLPPGRLTTERDPEQRILGACVLESHLLAGLLRHRGIPVRIRAGYFANIRADGEHGARFWGKAAVARARHEGLSEAQQAVRGADARAYTRRQNQVDHHIEHWICEYWDDGGQRWQLLDANTDFLRAHGNIETGFRLPAHYFEFAHQAWQRLRSATGVHPDQHAEDPQDGWSHIRSQLLSDFYSLLRHDVAGSDGPSGVAWQFIKGQTFAETPEREREQLDELAALLARDAELAELTGFYWRSPELRLANAEADDCSAVFRR